MIAIQPITLAIIKTLLSQRPELPVDDETSARSAINDRSVDVAVAIGLSAPDESIFFGPAI